MFGLFKKEVSSDKWVDLSSQEQLEDLIEQSNEKPVLLFKHSTRCATSLMAKRELDSNIEILKDDVIAVYLDLLRHRDISNRIAEEFNVIHESPQVLLIKNGSCIYNASHSEIKTNVIKRQL
ncbi:bacillithiol system redox-active protein YtxJ [Paracrocinitomix mangrovi]|uniref:bacillithiol system redox-active protein YtxJ n=1 Tax=Paracrocinitomix mangrovi TaxID=2862509 RepID=UPI001C8E8582|nr:bacillithiol system redox-active protein YtxJ [Paracrocinitomix mangrovi]UKN00493.1 bacillithiol system redox-active protein YtxJ [Paracrocinitomix mangrovi]